MSRETLLALVNAAKPAELPQVAADLAHALTLAIARSAMAVVPAPQGEPVALLGVTEAAQRLGVAKVWLYRHHPKLPFTRRLGTRTLRFDARALDRWMATRARSATPPDTL